MKRELPEYTPSIPHRQLQVKGQSLEERPICHNNIRPIMYRWQRGVLGAFPGSTINIRNESIPVIKAQNTSLLPFPLCLSASRL